MMLRVSTSYFAFLVVVSFVVVFADDVVQLTNGEKQSLAKLRLDQLPEKLKRAVQDVVNPIEHWCCKIHPTKVVINSQAVQVYIQRSTPHTNYGKCGLWGWKRCARQYVTYYKSSTYKTIYRKKTVETTCPDVDIVCCNGFLEVAHNCLPISELPNIKGDLIKLKQQGVLVG